MRDGAPESGGRGRKKRMGTLRNGWEGGGRRILVMRWKEARSTVGMESAKIDLFAVDNSQLTFMHRIPKTGRILLGKTHNPLCRSISKKIRFLDTINKSIVHHNPFSIKSDQFLIRPVAEMHR